MRREASSRPERIPWRVASSFRTVESVREGFRRRFRGLRLRRLRFHVRLGFGFAFPRTHQMTLFHFILKRRMRYSIIRPGSVNRHLPSLDRLDSFHQTVSIVVSVFASLGTSSFTPSSRLPIIIRHTSGIARHLVVPVVVIRRCFDDRYVSVWSSHVLLHVGLRPVQWLLELLTDALCYHVTNGGEEVLGRWIGEN